MFVGNCSNVGSFQFNISSLGQLFNSIDPAISQKNNSDNLMKLKFFKWKGVSFNVFLQVGRELDFIFEKRKGPLLAGKRNHFVRKMERAEGIHLQT